MKEARLQGAVLQYCKHRFPVEKLKITSPLRKDKRNTKCKLLCFTHCFQQYKIPINDLINMGQNVLGNNGQQSYFNWLNCVDEISHGGDSVYI